jgi:hypothetical protein
LTEAAIMKNLGIKKPGIAPGLVYLRDNRTVNADPIALPNFNHATVKYEQFCK